MENSHATCILFDVNETLLDMTPLKERINLLLGHPDAFRIWFGLLLQYSLVDNSTDQYHDFPTIGDATLEMAAQSFGKTIADETRKSALALMRQLPPHPDVEPGLKRLREAGFRMATLTNSPENVMMAQLEFSGLIHYFEKKLSIDTIKKYKPSLSTYHWAAEQFSVPPANIILVAAHGWDIAGASLAGLQTAFIARKGQSLYPLVQAPDFQGDNLEAVAGIIIKKNKI
jgi:2-haloacid dehalogenase